MIARKRLGVIKLFNCVWLSLCVACGQVIALEESSDNRQELVESYANRTKRNYSGERIYVTGEVVNPKTFDLKDLKTLNLKEALRQCNGPTPDSSHRIMVIRDSKIYKIATKTGDLATIMLDGGDLVFVPHKLYIGR
jgi:hypothetical protein